MDRRSFLFSLLGLGAAAIATTTLPVQDALAAPSVPAKPQADKPASPETMLKEAADNAAWSWHRPWHRRPRRRYVIVRRRRYWRRRW